MTPFWLLPQMLPAALGFSAAGRPTTHSRAGAAPEILKRSSIFLQVVN
jgi:hypothetical protein